MSLEPKLLEDQFQEQLTQNYHSLNANDTLIKLRTKAWEQFLELGLPNRQSEVFRYLRMRNLFAQKYHPLALIQIEKEAFESLIFPECLGSVFVFINGRYKPTLSQTTRLPKQMVALSLNEAIKTYGTFLNNHWTKANKEETDPFASLNTSLHAEGLFLYLPPKCLVEQPIQILHLIDASSNIIMPKIQLFAGSRSEANILSNVAFINGDSCWINQTIDLALEEDAHVKYTETTVDSPSTLWLFSALRANLKRNSSLHTLNLTNGGGTIRNDYRVSLAGEGAEALLNGLWMLSDKREVHTHVLMDHQAPHCHSMQTFKGVNKDFGRSSFEGKILVRQPAQKTEAYQLNHNLLMNDGAIADSKPNLEIFADDVKASHGATVGQLDEEQIFYMKTRGFSEIEAKSFLVYGFCQEMIDRIPLPSLKNLFMSRAQSFLTQIMK